MRRITWLVPALALVMLLGMAPDAKAQNDYKPWLIELYGGAFVPLSPDNWADFVTTSIGLGGAVGYGITPKFYLLVQGTWGLVTGATVNDIKLSNVDFFAYYLAVAYDFTYGKSVSLMGQVGVGGNTFSGEGASSSNTYPAVNGGFKVYYNVNPQIGLSLNALLAAAFAKKEDFTVDETGTQVILNLPISIGVFFRF